MFNWRQPIIGQHLNESLNEQLDSLGLQILYYKPNIWKAFHLCEHSYASSPLISAIKKMCYSNYFNGHFISLHNKNTAKQNTFKHCQEDAHFNVTFSNNQHKNGHLVSWIKSHIIYNSMTSLNTTDLLINDIQLTLTHSNIVTMTLGNIQVNKTLSI